MTTSLWHPVELDGRPASSVLLEPGTWEVSLRDLAGETLEQGHVEINARARTQLVLDLP